jgi:flagellar biosynthesis/type III secretory pathway M-ring protein FliF/YscJ
VRAVAEVAAFLIVGLVLLRLLINAVVFPELRRRAEKRRQADLEELDRQLSLEHQELERLRRQREGGD